MALKINEIFHSIQGESIHVGIPCVFVRLSGCNLRCSYCDTAYAYEEGKKMDVDDILNPVSSFKCPVVEVTGGEPLTQKDTPLLINRLLDVGYRVMLETNGSFDIGKVDKRCIKIVDIKCPSSNEKDSSDLDNLKRLQHIDQVKFVIQDRKDYEYARQKAGLIPQGFPADHILFSPVDSKIPPSELAKWILEDHLNVRLHLQLHKIIWPDVNRGV
jgi:7-carboxy-7-deazaguanine synthase